MVYQQLYTAVHTDEYEYYILTIYIYIYTVQWYNVDRVVQCGTIWYNGVQIAPYHSVPTYKFKISYLILSIHFTIYIF